MTFSPLTDVILETTKRSGRGNARVSRVIVHNWAGMHGGIERLVYSTDAASSNYIILSQAYKMPRAGRRLNGSTVPAGTVLPAGTIIGSVPEEYRAWTSGSAAADNSSITFEIQNSTPAIPGEISQAAWNSSVRLLADIAKRYRFPKIEFGSTVRGHKEFQDTSCPGPWLWPRLPQLAADAQQARTTTPTTTPNTPITLPEGIDDMQIVTLTGDATQYLLGSDGTIIPIPNIEYAQVANAMVAKNLKGINKRQRDVLLDICRRMKEARK